jgi:murein DD-endopeptidase MepM/ murein hydrolase activator NlpD
VALSAGAVSALLTSVIAVLHHEPAVSRPDVVIAAASLSQPATPISTVDDWHIGEARRIDSAPARPSRGATIAGAFVWPARGALTGWFGERRGHGRHPGIDIDGTTGDPVHAASAGVVRIAGRAPSGYSGYGLMVLIEHGNGTATLYAHLSKIATNVGTLVDAGDLIGAIGTTGSVTGSHLHFEVRMGDRTVDPMDWLPSR